MNLHRVKNLWLRWTRGIGCCDVYDFYCYLAPKILVGLKTFKAKGYSHPANLTFEEWNEMLDDMIYSFQAVVDGKDGFSLNDEEYKRYERGFKLFGEWYTALWV